MGSTQLAAKAPKEQAFIRQYLAGSIMAKVAVMEQLGPQIAQAGATIAACMAKGRKWLICGNGGSAADAQHLAAEMVGRLYKLERRGLPAIALTTDSSALTCVGNDYGYEDVFERQVEALALKGDVVMGISTSGNSPNVLKALALAKRMGCATIGLSGAGGGKLAASAGLCISVPSRETFHVQECHIAIGHLICFLVERDLLARRYIKERK
jgi:D-sedoheptulose 7-phosphate isomerase